jgi:hypothetical protein
MINSLTSHGSLELGKSLKSMRFNEYFYSKLCLMTPGGSLSCFPSGISTNPAGMTGMMGGFGQHNPNIYIYLYVYICCWHWPLALVCLSMP